MHALRIHLALGLVIALAVSMSATASADPGGQIKTHPHTTRHTYDKPYHRLQGRVGITNGSSHTVSLRCNVVVLLKGSGTAHKRGSDIIHARIGAGGTRKPHFAVKIRDANHDFDNLPTSTAAHCRQI